MKLQLSTEEFLQRLFLYSKYERLPEEDALFSLAQKTCDTLLTESEAYRARLPKKELEAAFSSGILELDAFSKIGEPKSLDLPGGFLDFRAQDEKPCVVVPDIHARADFVFNVLNYVLPKKKSGLSRDIKIAEALDKGILRLVFVGDILHAESRAYERWRHSYDDFMRGEYAGQSMSEEMSEGLAAQMMIMECKCRWQSDAHILMGNHENIQNERSIGKRPFRKFFDEGEMVRRFMKAKYSKSLVDMIRCFERLLPLAFCANNIFVSHAEPRAYLEERLLICSPILDEVAFALVWTANDEAEDFSVKKMLDEHCRPRDGVKAKYIGGHRTIMGKYKLRQDGLFVQIHNPMEQNIALVLPDTTFEPEKQIMAVNGRTL